MALEEKDFVLRQTKELAKGLGQFLSDDTLDDLFNDTTQSSDGQNDAKKNKNQHARHDDSGKMK